MSNPTYRATRTLPLALRLLQGFILTAIVILLVGLGFAADTHYQHARLRSQLQLVLRSGIHGTRTTVAATGWTVNPAQITETYRVHEPVGTLNSQLTARLKANGYQVEQPGGPLAIFANNNAKKTNIVIFEQSSAPSERAVVATDAASGFTISAHYGRTSGVTLPSHSQGQ